MMNTYEETLSWLYERLPMFQRIGAPAYKPGLDNTYALMSMLENPHHKVRTIHIAGTNGKGSVSSMLASVLQEAGYKTGLYTSPHLFDFRERIRIQGQLIPKDYVINFIKTYKDRILSISPSFFEITFAMAVKWFEDEKVDISVIETGMGGRLDSTNVINPVLSIITNISFDHMQFLGDTLEKIATEKAGIIKRKVPVVIGRTQNQIKHVFIDKAKKEKSKIYFADQNLKFQYTTQNYHHFQGYVLRKNKLYSKTLFVPLVGSYQQENILTVVESARRLKKMNFYLKKRHIRNGIFRVKENTGLMGRWEILKIRPLVVCDVAHNAEGLKLVFSQIQQHNFEKLYVIIGFSDDKKLEDFVEFLPKHAYYFATQAKVPRAMECEKIYSFLKSNGFKVQLIRNINDAYKNTLDVASPNDAILITGSIFVIAEIYDLMDKYKKFYGS